MKQNNYIKLYRQFRQTPYYTESKAVHVWLECLLRASFSIQEKYLRREKIELKPGQFVMGREEFGSKIGISGSTVWYWINQFEADSMIDTKKTTKGSIITIRNWEKYQRVDNTSDNKKTTEKQQKNTIKNVKKEKKVKNTISKDIEQGYGNEEINNLFQIFEDIMGFKSSGKKDRFMAKHLLNTFTELQLKGLLSYCSTEPYAPRVGSLEKLWYKRGDVIAGIKSLQLKSNSTKPKGRVIL